MSDLFEQQAAIHRRNRRRRIVQAVVSGLSLLVAFWVFYWAFVDLPLRLCLSRGNIPQEVIGRAGEPLRAWKAGEFDGYEAYPGDRSKAKGPVLFFMRMGIGYYVFFDEKGALYEIDVTTS